MPPTLGPFEVESFLARGGMGAVWAGIHTATRVPVAIKVLTGRGAKRPKFRQSFRDEVRAVARLNHPGIVGVLDFGEVSAEVHEATARNLPTGSPYLVMPRAAGSLQDARPPQNWAEVQAIVDQLLAALAHAHARGVLHRDLKPGNVLVPTLKAWGDGPIAPCFENLQLADFGLARIGNDPRAGQGESKARGTPRYMAPEAGLGLWRDHGPWTDLYAVGCIAWELVSGSPPFNADSRNMAIQAHISRALPNLLAALQVPPELEAWLARLLHKDPYSRFSCAADARSALEGLGEPTGDVSVRTSNASASLTWSESLLSSGETQALPDPPPRPTPQPIIADLPRIPADWRDATSPTQTLLLPGAGLGIFGLRNVPIAGREAERDLLWSELREVASERRGRVVVLDGPAGRGKSRLAQWTRSLAAEVGAATGLHTRFGRDRRTDLLEPIRRYLKTSDETSESLETRIAGLWPDEAGAWTGLSRALTRQVRPSARDERAMLGRWIASLGRDRAVVLWLDDAHWSADALAFASLAAESPLPVLVICTIRSDDLKDSNNSEAFEPLCAADGVSRISLEPLDVGAHAELVRDLLGLHPRLAGEVVARTAGNPLFAVQLVGDWVNRGVLEHTTGGFEVRAGASVHVPADVRALCQSRMSTLAEAAGEAGLFAVELAATLGWEVQFAEWSAAATLASVELPADLVDELFSQRLARRIDGGWAFEHGLLREAVLDRSTASGRSRVYHHAAARMLQTRYGDAAPPGRLGRHLAAAERHREALDPLARGAWEARVIGDHHGLSHHLQTYADSLAALGLAPDDPAAIRHRTLLAWQAVYDGKLQDAEDLAAAAVADCAGKDLPLIQGEARFIVAQVARSRGRPNEAIAGFLETLTLFESLRDERRSVACYRGLGAVARDLGRLDEAEKWYLKALDSDAIHHGHTWHALGAIAAVGGRLPVARERLQRALAIQREHGSLTGTVEALNGLADIDRYQGDLEKAETGYRHALIELQRIGFYTAVTVRLNLTQVFLARGDADLAEVEVTIAEAEYRRQDDRRFIGVCAVLRAEVAARRGQWHVALPALEEGARLLEDTGFTEPDIAHSLDRIVALGKEARGPVYERACELAAAQWSRLRPTS